MKSWFCSEDVLAVNLGVFVIGLSLATLAGWNLLGWSVAVKEWAVPESALVPSSPAFTGMTGPGALATTFAFLVVVLSAGADFLGVPPGLFARRFAVLFLLAFACWVAGHNAYIAANPKTPPPGVGWSLGLTFFSIGMATNVRRFWAEGLGRLALVYVVSLFGFVVWIGLAISWLFFQGVPAGGK